MNTVQFLEAIRITEPDEARYSVVEKHYGVNLEDDVRRVCSLNPPPFWEGREVCRVLSLPEIVHAESELHVAFGSLGLVPILDRGDNNFVVYNVRIHQWAMFNIIDEVMWYQGKPLEELLP